MDKNALKFIEDLLGQYERSAFYKNQTRSQRILIKYKQGNLFDKVFVSPDAFKYKQNALNDLNILKDKGFINLNFDRNNSIEEIILNIDKVNELYKYLGKENPKDYLKSILDFLNSLQYEGTCKKFINDEVNYINEKFTYRKSYYSNIDELKNILKCVDAIELLQEETMERDFSTRVLGNSKAFKPLSNKVCKIIKEYNDNVDADMFENDEDLLASLYLVKNSTYALIKNKLVFKLNNQVIDLDKLGFEYSLDDKMIKSIELMDCDFQKVITVENLTTFHMLKDDDAVIIYLAGFHNHTKRELIKKIYQRYPNKEWYHFSDIDVGGFRIFVNLVKRTQIAFKPYKMGISELTSESVSLKPLTDNDKKALNDMINNSEYQIFKSTIEYMLEHNVKLEQENLD